ncbi:MAG: response regulator [Candidatus Brocadiae bacterium]|nr:response regulator [Candidatus Brocadiia bacterium]
MSKILLIDDSIFTLNHYSEMIAKLGHEVLMANSGEEGVQVFIQSKPDMVLCDLMMPEMDGFEVLTQIKGNKKDFAYFFLVTADVQESTRAKALKLGARDLVCKPLTQEQMVEVLKRYGK